MKSSKICPWTASVPSLLQNEELQGPLHGWSQLLHKFAMQRTGKAGTDGITYILSIELKASEKLVTTLGLLVTWWALLFAWEWGDFGVDWWKAVSFCCFSECGTYRVVLCRAERSRLCTSEFDLTTVNEKWLIIVTAQSFIRPFRASFQQTSSKSPFLVQADLQEHKTFLFPKGFPPPA